MANRLYGSYRLAMLNGAAPDLRTADIRAILVDLADYTPDTGTTGHDFLNDIPAGARVAVSGALQNVTTTGAVLDADDITISGVTGDPTEAIVLYVHTGTETTSRLLAIYDAGSVTLTPNGGGATIQWDNGSSKILAV